MESALYKSYMRQISKYPLLSFEEEIELSRKIQQGDNAAKMKLVQSNLKLVVSLAMRYENSAVSIMDLIQEGNIGLLTAAGKYHYSYNTRFSTYAYAWIVQSITRYIKSKAGAIALPGRKEDILRKINAVRIHLFQEFGREPTNYEIADKLCISVSEIIEAQNFSFSVVSMNSDVDRDGGQKLEDVIPDAHFTPERQMMYEERKREVHDLLKKLPEMEQMVVYNRYNFRYDEKVKTLRQLGDELGVSAETVRQMEIRAINRLKKLVEAEGLSKIA